MKQEKEWKERHSSCLPRGKQSGALTVPRSGKITQENQKTKHNRNRKQNEED